MDPRFRGCDRWGGCFGIRLVAGLAQISYKSKNFFAEGRQPLLHHHLLPCRGRDRHRPVQPGGPGGGGGDGRQPVPVGCTPDSAFPLSRGNHVVLLLFQASLCGTVDPRFRGCDRWGGCFGIRLVAGLAQISYKSKNFFAEGRQPLRCQGPNPYGPRDGLCGRGAPRRESGGDVLFHGGRVAGASTLARGARVRVGARSRGRAIRESPLRPGWGGVGGVRGGPLRVPLGQALRQAQGERIWEVRVRRGVGDAMGDGDAPRCAPALGSRFHGNDDGGVGVMRGLVVVVRVPLSRDGRFANRPYGFGWRSGIHDSSLWWGRPTLLGLLSRGTTGWRGVLMRGLVVVEGPSRGSGRTDLGGAPSVGSGGCDGGRRRAAPSPCPGFPPSHGNDDGGWGSRSRGTALRQAQGDRDREPPLRIRVAFGDRRQ